ncbi:MAG: hypothetical protein PHY90_10245 [Desulfitobacteriaceae bacterium]|nr:hypothetical protein [Desulfitobacteriaceae bacterium]
MKQISMLALILVWLLAGCSYSRTDLSKPTSPETQSVSEEKTVSKEDVIQIFTNAKDHRDCIVTDCVVAEDSAYGLIGVVQYTNIDGNPCCLAFIKDSWSCPIGLDADNSTCITNDSVLTYIGNGTVQLSLISRETGIVYDYMVEYSCEGADSNFKVTSTERS